MNESGHESLVIRNWNFAIPRLIGVALAVAVCAMLAWLAAMAEEESAQLRIGAVVFGVILVAYAVAGISGFAWSMRANEKGVSVRRLFRREEISWEALVSLRLGQMDTNLQTVMVATLRFAHCSKVRIRIQPRQLGRLVSLSGQQLGVESPAWWRWLMSILRGE
ncbi:hypothetical protein LCGC14_2230170 [marine sediment metagenome]|uniref:Low molecular weight protein antigen 6 PH domain-containing protein n=1 Tax=marine sediment metagenome TaxID=412755 RepID=A0A0F9D8C9_9ZZZZ